MSRTTSPKVVSSVSTTKIVDLELSADCIADFLREAGYIPKGIAVSSVFIRVPGGGDWSHCDLDIGKDNPVIVRYSIEEHSVTGKIK